VKELVEFVARSLVEDPTQVQVTQSLGTGKINLELRVAKDDMGRIIGKSGRVANALRVLLRVAAAREGKQVSLDVIEPR
jgi:Predicted RNA-binding protein (contains KH domain)